MVFTYLLNSKSHFKPPGLSAIMPYFPLFQSSYQEVLPWRIFKMSSSYQREMARLMVISLALGQTKCALVRSGLWLVNLTEKRP
jgi:predicted Kef-type K+ transport protein